MQNSKKISIITSHGQVMPLIERQFFNWHFWLMAEGDKIDQSHRRCKSELPISIINNTYHNTQVLKEIDPNWWQQGKSKEAPKQQIKMRDRADDVEPRFYPLKNALLHQQTTSRIIFYYVIKNCRTNRVRLSSLSAQKCELCSVRYIFSRIRYVSQINIPAVCQIVLNHKHFTILQSLNVL